MASVLIMIQTGKLLGHFMEDHPFSCKNHKLIGCYLKKIYNVRLIIFKILIINRSKKILSLILGAWSGLEISLERIAQVPQIKRNFNPINAKE